MKKTITILLFCVLSLGASAQSETEKANIKKLLILTGTDKVTQQMMANISASFKKNLPDVSNEFWDEFFKEANVNEIIELIIPIYAKHYSASEIEQLTAFYNTPLGKKVTATLPLITQDSYKIGEAWGKTLGERVVQKLTEKGYLKNQ